MNLNDFQNLLLNREELEKALGIKISNSKQADLFLDDYAMFEYIKLEEVTALFLGLNPNEFTKNQKHPRYWTIFNAVQTAVRQHHITAKVNQEFDINGNEYQFDVYLTHDTARQWAKTHGLKWNVPPYRPLIAEPDTITNNNNPDEIARLNAIIEQQSEKIARLEDKLQGQMKLSPMVEIVQTAVDYENLLNKEDDDYLKPDPLSIALEVRKKYWLDYPNNKKSSRQIKDWIKKEYKINETLAEHIEITACPIDRKRN